jgi:hypothetical protein
MYKATGQTLLRAIDTAGFVGGARDEVSATLAVLAARESRSAAMPLRATDTATSSPGAFLASELEKRDPLVRTPLTAVTYPENIPVRTGGGWVETVSNLTIDYGSAGADDDANVAANGADVMPIIQGNFNKDIYKTHLFIQPLSINEFDMLRQNITGRSLDKLLGDGVRLAYDKHMDKNCVPRLEEYARPASQQSECSRTTVAEGSAAFPTAWASKTADEILYDINSALQTVWSASGNDLSAIPNHILLPFEQYNLLISTKVSLAADKSIMEFLKENNLAKNHGKELAFGCTNYAKGVGLAPQTACGLLLRRAVHRCA